VGRFAPLKGIDALLGAVADLQKKIPCLYLWVVGGDGPQSESARAFAALAADLGIRDRVTFAGCIDQTVLPMYYSACDLLVVPSHYESFGLVILEALACGTPVVATPVGAVETIIRPGINGMIVDKPSRDRVARGIDRVLSAPFEGRRTRLAVRSTVAHCGWDRMAAAVLQTYGNLCRTRSSAPLPLEVDCSTSSN
jgi:D-inositol-3-phosphate glycosyltransferase